MNWIILIIAGLFEVAFASCLGKAKEATGNDVYWWYGGFVVTMTISMLLLLKLHKHYRLELPTLFGQELVLWELFSWAFLYLKTP